MISASMRHGVPAKIIHEQLMKTGPKDFTSFERGIARVLKKYIYDGEASTGVCPECGQKSLIYSEGCLKCKNCFYQGCGA